MKRINLWKLFTLTAMLSMLVMVCSYASAEGTQTVAYAVTGGNIYFDPTTGTVTGCDDTVTTAVIPARIQGVNVTTIGRLAFDSKDNLTRVVLPEGITTIEFRAFGYNSSLTSVNLPSSVTTIAGGAFNVTTSLHTVGPAGGGYDIEYGWEQAIPEDAFEAATGVNSVVIADGITTLGENCFSSTAITQLSLPDSVTSIEAHAFESCTKLATIHFSNNLTSIGERAFEGCTSLQPLNLPYGLQTIGHRAFGKCQKLTSVYIPASVTSIGTMAFWRCSGLTQFYVDNGNTRYKAIDGVLFSDMGRCLHSFPTARAGSYVVPDGVTTIGDSSFEDCLSITGIRIPYGVTYIENWAFYGCEALKTVTLPGSVTYIGNNGFRSCTTLEKVYYYGTEAQWSATSFGFYNEPIQEAPIEFVNHTVTVTAGANGTASASATVAAEGQTVTLSVSANNGYRFRQWNVASGNVTITNNAFTMGNSNVSIEAVFEQDTLTVTFDPRGGTVSPTSKSVINGQVFGDLPVPVYSGHVFQGWFTASSGGAQITSGTTVNLSGNTTLYAHWTEAPGPYTLHFDANGGSGAPSDQACASGAALTIPSTVPARFGYDFMGWGTSSASSAASYYPGGSVTMNANMTLYAVWKSAILVDRPTLPRTVDVNMNIAGAARYLRIIPQNSGDLVLETTSGYDTYGVLYGSAGNQLAANDDDGSGNNFRIGVSLTAGHSYYLRVTMYSSSLAPGNITVSISAIDTYVITYDANGGTGAPAAQTKTHDTAMTLSTATPARANSSAGSYTVTLNANGGSVNPSALTAARTTSYSFRNWNTASDGSGTSYAPGASYTANAAATLYAQWNSSTTTSSVSLPAPARSGYDFKGWGTSAGASSGVTGSYTPSGNVTLYAVWEANITYTIAYNANGGTGTPSSQTKTKDVPLTLSSTKPYKEYTIRYNANGGNVSPASKSLDCTFINWNTDADGHGSSYSSGGTYYANAGATLYAQWTNPAAGALAKPTRSGYVFTGWYTAVSGGTQVTDSTTITGNMTVYAHWTDIYNMGDETYSFHNYSDSDSNGHCFGMASTSAGYHLNLLDIRSIGGSAGSSLYSFGATSTVKLPICYYQGLQGWRAIDATVAGGSFWSYSRASMASDWPAVVNYVRNHTYDDTGEILITFWKKKSNGWSGHAVNFLRYQNVNGQDRIYVYDNNNPTSETYFYRDSSGNVWETPYSTYGNVPIDSIGLHDVRTYFGNCNGFDPTHVLYATATGVSVEGYTSTPLVGELADEPYVMYEIPSDQRQVTIVPNQDYADVIYMDTEYSFGEVTEGTYAVLRFATLNAAGDVTQGAEFQIFDGDLVLGPVDLKLPEALTQIGVSAFEGIQASVVYVPDSCTSIGAYAFRNAAVRKIRVPAGCTIASTAFSGCEEVRIFGTPGSPAETFCNSHSNCTFVTEQP